jgi:scyllo-inositol 2-dehydrogenase (NADP+)
LESFEQFGTLTRANSNGASVETIKSEEGVYVLFFKNLYSAIREGDTLLVSGSDAALVIKVIEAAILSNREHRSVFL